MVYFNYIAMGLICVFILIAALVKKRRPLSERFERLIESRRFEIVFIAVLLIVGAALRLIGLSELPAGMNQDEASIGYDSWAIANYGVDRNGYHNPVYPVAWGAGHGAPSPLDASATACWAGVEGHRGDQDDRLARPS